MERNEIEVVVVPRDLLDAVIHQPWDVVASDARLTRVVKRRYPGHMGDKDKGVAPDLYDVDTAYLRQSDSGEFPDQPRGSVACLYYQGWTA
jgi:hypothetical protein